MFHLASSAHPASGRRSTFRCVAPILAALVAVTAGCTARPPPTTKFDGAYRGAVVLANDPGGYGVLCAPPTNWQPMTVSDGAVSFGQFRGYVEPNGTVSMLLGSFGGGIELAGSFGDGRFVGYIEAPQPGCNYRLNLTRQAG